METKKFYIDEKSLFKFEVIQVENDEKILTSPFRLEAKSIVENELNGVVVDRPKEIPGEGILKVA